MTAPADLIDGDHLWQRLEALAAFGTTPAGGVNRQALSAEEAGARLKLAEWATAAGLRPETDPAGNVFLVLDGEDPEAPAVLAGSHIDSQPTGGRFDGGFGVLAALAAVEAILRSGGRPRRTIAVVAWMNEEGSRFAPGMMGSAVFGGARPLEEVLAVRDAAGTSVAEALAGMPPFAPCSLRNPVHAFIEPHIEQGTVLEKAGVNIGIVTGIQGKITWRVTVTGEGAHAGTASRAERRDALFAAMDIVSALRSLTEDPEDLTRFTVGAFTVQPNAPSVVPASVVFSIDLRHPLSRVLTALGARVPELCAANGGRCDVDVVELSRADSLEFPGAIQDRIRDAAASLGIPAMALPSAAGHDARYLHPVCETGMIFIPCRDGISHREDEWAEPEAVADGARVLTGVLCDLAEVGEA